MPVLAKMKIFGLVQGVFFRHSAKTQAEALNLKGFARNEENGSVYIEVEGSEENINEFIRWCHEGVPPASVSNLEVEFSDRLKNYRDFSIL